jgi:hypothetical protein
MVKYSKHAAPLNAAIAIAHGHPPAKITTAAALSMNTALTVRLTRSDAFFGVFTGAPSAASDAAPLATHDRLSPTTSRSIIQPAPRLDAAHRRVVVVASTRLHPLCPTNPEARATVRARPTSARVSTTARARARTTPRIIPPRATRDADVDVVEDDDRSTTRVTRGSTRQPRAPAMDASDMTVARERASEREEDEARETRARERRDDRRRRAARNDARGDRGERANECVNADNDED